MPDEKTIWEFRDNLVRANIIDSIFYRVTRQLEEKKIITYSESIIDATFVEAPRQRNSRKENEEIKEGKAPGEWNEEKNRNKRRQKDTDARWTKKRDEVHYGYKDHVKVDRKHKLTNGYTQTVPIREKEYKNAYRKM